MTWEPWQAGRAERRRAENLVVPKNIRLTNSEGDEYLRETYDGGRGLRRSDNELKTCSTLHPSARG